MEVGEEQVTAVAGDMEFFDAHEISVVCCDRGNSNINMERAEWDGWRDAKVSTGISNRILDMERLESV